jgi:hypothetical protein
MTQVLKTPNAEGEFFMESNFKHDSDSRRKILILGDFIHEGLKTSIATLGFDYVKKFLHGLRGRGWRLRLELLRTMIASGELSATILYLPTPTLLHCAKEEFRDIWREVLGELKKTRSIVFVFEDNLAGRFKRFDWLEEDGPSEDEVYGAEGSTVRQDVIEFLKAFHEMGIEIVPFSRRADVTVRLQEFLQDLDEGIFLRLYVPRGRYQSEQLASFLRVFERYLRQVESRPFSVDWLKTELGTLYLFKSDDAMPKLDEINSMVSRFDAFMSLCKDDPRAAEKALAEIGVDEMSSSHVVALYAKEYGRLLMDVRHEFEHKKLLLQHRFESELLEVGADRLVPRLESGHPSAFLSLAGNFGPISINFTGSNVQSGNTLATVEQMLNGGITYSDYDRELFRLFERHADSLEAAQLRSDLDQLKDRDLPQASKKTAKQKILSFLHKTMATAGEGASKIAADALAAYLEKMVTGIL